MVDNSSQGVAFVEDVVDDQHAAAFHVITRRHQPVERAATGFVAITRGMQVGAFQRKLQARQQVASNNQATVHDGVHNRIAAGHPLGNVHPQSIDRGQHFLLVMQAVSVIDNGMGFREFKRHG